jgi:hypothetical protein
MFVHGQISILREGDIMYFQNSKGLLNAKYFLMITILSSYTLFFLSTPTEAQYQTKKPLYQIQKEQPQTQPVTPPRKAIKPVPTLVKRKINAVQVSTSDVQRYKPLIEPAPKLVTPKPVIRPQKGEEMKGKIEVISPKQGDEWLAGKEYDIRWKSTEIRGDVKISLSTFEHIQGKPSREKIVYTIAHRAADTGNFRFKVPHHMVVDPFPYVVKVSTLDGKVDGYSSGHFAIYAQEIDLTCKIMNYRERYQVTWYVVYIEGKRWIEFDVWLRNNGVRGPIDIYEVLVRIIKEPENVVVTQEEWGYGRIYPQVWYKLPEPEKFNVSSWEGAPAYYDKDVNFNKGAYRIEIDVDPQNRLHENQRLRSDNKAIQRFHIK